jgi:hypothetical protein
LKDCQQWQSFFISNYWQLAIKGTQINKIGEIKKRLAAYDFLNFLDF